MEKTKRLNDIHTVQHCENETYICGTDERGEEFTVVLETFELLGWIDKEYMKESVLKYVKNL